MSTKKNAVTVVTAAVMCAGAAVAASPMAPEASAAPTATTAASASKVYAAVAKAGGREYLRLVDTRSGRVTKTLGSGKVTVFGHYFYDIDLAPDGSVYAVTADSSLKNSYQTRLRRYTGKGVQNLQPYITTVKVAPDGRSLATTALSPDGDGDGYALEALRTATLKGVKVRDLMTWKVPVWGKGTFSPGSPVVNAGGTRVLGWLPGSRLAVDWSCCDSGSSWIVPTNRKNQATTLPPRNIRTLEGTAGTTIIGYKGRSVLQIQSDDDHIGRVRWGTSTNYLGKIVGNAGENFYDRGYEIARKYGATPLRISPRTYPYKGAGTVTQASL